MAKTRVKKGHPSPLTTVPRNALKWRVKGIHANLMALLQDPLADHMSAEEKEDLYRCAYNVEAILEDWGRR